MAINTGWGAVGLGGSCGGQERGKQGAGTKEEQAGPLQDLLEAKLPQQPPGPQGIWQKGEKPEETGLSEASWGLALQLPASVQFRQRAGKQEHWLLSQMFEKTLQTQQSCQQAAS